MHSASAESHDQAPDPRGGEVEQRAGRLHHQLAEMHDAEIGRAEMLTGAVGDRALAVLHRGVLLGDALDAGIAPGPLQLAIDQIVIRLVAQRHVVLVDHGHHAVEIGRAHV